MAKKPTPKKGKMAIVISVGAVPLKTMPKKKKKTVARKKK